MVYSNIGYFRVVGGSGWAAFDKKTGKTWRVALVDVPAHLKGGAA